MGNARVKPIGRFETVHSQIEKGKSGHSRIVACDPAARRVRHFAASAIARLNRRGQGLDQTKISARERCFGTIGAAECSNNGLDSGFDRRRQKTKRPGNIRVGFSGRDYPQHFDLAHRQPPRSPSCMSTGSARIDDEERPQFNAPLRPLPPLQGARHSGEARSQAC